jgi:hypothetical protein
MLEVHQILNRLRNLGYKADITVSHDRELMGGTASKSRIRQEN